MKKRRLYQILRRSGLIDTKVDAIKLLNKGKVKVGGVITKNPDFQLNPAKREVTVDDKPIELLEEHYYFMLNKPPRYLCHRQREHGKKHILELIDEPEHIRNVINPVGRLDYETRGLIILTSDGDFANGLLQPRTKVEKEYEVLVKGELSDKTKEEFERGIEITVEGDRRKGTHRTRHETKPCKIDILKRSKQSTLFSIALIEGKKRQIRKMMKEKGLKVLDLKRVRIGKLKLGNLKEGCYRSFRKSDVV